MENKPMDEQLGKLIAELRDVLRKQEKLAFVVGENVTKKDFVNSFKNVMELVIKIEKKQSDSITQLEKTYAQLLAKMQGDHSMNVSDIKVMVKGEMAKMLKEHQGKMYAMDEKMDSMVDGMDGNDGHTPTENELRALIKPLIPKPVKGDKGDDGKEGKIGSSTTIFGGRTGGASKFHPLTADGTTKIFAVPKSVAAILHCSDFPSILYENSGFTINANRTQITITTTNAPSNGAQLLYQYSSMFS